MKYLKVFSDIENLPQVSIAAVNGFAIDMCLSIEDQKDGINDFLENRKANFKDL